MYYFYNYFNIFTAPLLCLLALGHGLLGVIFCFATAFMIHPFMDWFMNRFFREKMLTMNGESQKSWSYDLPLLVAVPFQITLVIVAFMKASTPLEAVCAGALCGLSGGILGIATSHELIHRSKKWQRAYGQIMLFTINYAHFGIEHLWHHIAVATPQDSDTAFKNESIYQFWKRSIPQGWLECWKWEARKLKKKKQSALSKNNKMLMISLTQLLLIVAVTLIISLNAGIVFIVQGLVTLMLLKWINYVEHYGLERKLVNGKWEQVNEKCSWDSTSALTNFSLFNLGFHTEHHMRPGLNYYELPKAKDHWNDLPQGYSAMMMLALIPKKWKSVMDKELQKLNYGRA